MYNSDEDIKLNASVTFLVMLSQLFPHASLLDLPPREVYSHNGRTMIMIMLKEKYGANNDNNIEAKNKMGKKEGRETNINKRRNTPSKRKMEIRIKSK